MRRASASPERKFVVMGRKTVRWNDLVSVPCKGCAGNGTVPTDAGYDRDCDYCYGSGRVLQKRRESTEYESLAKVKVTK